MITPERLVEIRKRVDSASDAPWDYLNDEHEGLSIWCGEAYLETGEMGGFEGWHRDMVTSDDDPSWCKEDLEFVTKARTDIPDLLGHIKALEDRLLQAWKAWPILRLQVFLSPPSTKQLLQVERIVTEMDEALEENKE